MALMDTMSDLFGGVAKAAGYALGIYVFLQWYMRNQPGGTQLPPVLATEPAAQQQQKGKKDKRAKAAAAKGLGSGLGPAAEPSEIEPAEDDEKAAPNKVMPRSCPQAGAGAALWRLPCG
jgi:hypothetical protein